MPSSNGERYAGVRSVETAAVVLKVLADAKTPLTLTDIASQAVLAPAKAHRYLLTLVEMGMVDRIRAGRYALGDLSARIGLAALARFDPLEDAATRLTALANDTGAAALLAVPSTNRPVVYRFERAQSSRVPAIGLGTEIPMTGTATGAAFAAHLPDEDLKRFLEADTGSPVTDVSAWRPAERDNPVFAASTQTLHSLSSIAAPVFGPAGSIMAVVTLISHDHEIVSPSSAAWQALKHFTRAPVSNGV